MIKEFKAFDQGSMPVNPVVITLKSDELIGTERRQELEAISLRKE